MLIKSDLGLTNLTEMTIMLKGNTPVVYSYLYQLARVEKEKVRGIIREMLNYSFEIITLAVVSSLNGYRVYILGLKFTMVTNCNALRYPRGISYLELLDGGCNLQEYDCTIKYRLGCRMSHVNALGRDIMSWNCPSKQRIG